MANRDEDILLKVGVDKGGEGAKSLSTLRKEYADLNKELDKTDVGSKKYLDTLKKLGAVKDEIGDLRDTINALNPEGKVQAFTNVAGKLAGGFQAATGAAALFGIESQELEKTLLKVQAATAFAEGIRSISGMSDAFNVLGTVIKTNVVTALTTLKGAIIATGLGALAVAIGILIAKTIEYNEAIEEEYDKQRKLNEELKKTTDEYLKQAAASEQLRNSRKGGLNDLERELKLLEAQGATASEIFEKKKQIFDAEIFNLKVRRSTIEGDSAAEAELTQKILDKEIEKQALILANRKRLSDEARKAAEEEKKLYDEVWQKVKEGQDKELEYKRKIKEEELQLANEYWERATSEENARIEKQNQAKLQAEIDYQDAIKTLYAEQDKEVEDSINNEISLEKEKQNRILDLAQTSNKANQDLSDAFFNYKFARVKKGSEEEEKLAKKQFQINKALQIQTAIITGIQGVLNALAAPSAIPEPAGSVWKAVTAVSMGIAAAAQVAKIASVQFNSGASSGSADTSTPSINSPAPVVNTQAPTIQPTTRLNEQGQNLNPTFRVKAELVETEATSTQKRVSRLESQAEF